MKEANKRLHTIPYIYITRQFTDENHLNAQKTIKKSQIPDQWVPSDLFALLFNSCLKKPECKFLQTGLGKNWFENQRHLVRIFSLCCESAKVSCGLRYFHNLFSYTEKISDRENEYWTI